MIILKSNFFIKYNYIFMTNGNQQSVKIYQIDTSYYEFGKRMSLRDKVDFIMESHKEGVENKNVFHSQSSSYLFEDVEYVFYNYYFEDSESVWKNFLPLDLTQNVNFNVEQPSFILFLIVESNIFVTVGGRGSAIVKKYRNSNFGLDIYQKIANPTQDIIHSIDSRGITGNLASEQRAFRNEQKLADSLSIGQIPKSMMLTLNHELVDSLFDFIDFGDSSNVNLAISASFHLKFNITFDEVNSLIKVLSGLLKKEDLVSLSRFKRIVDKSLIKSSLVPRLHDYLYSEYDKVTNPRGNDNRKLDFDFVHPQKLLSYHEAEEYKVFLKNARKPLFTTKDRNQVFTLSMRYIFELEDRPTDQFSFIRYLMGAKVKSYSKKSKLTEAPFITHVSCEISVKDSTYFLIDKDWYAIKGDFVEEVNQECLSLIEGNELQPNPLCNFWDIEFVSEGDYNLSYLDEDGFTILDKVLSQNIELCDLLYETKDMLYLIHVKGGFDAKIRDLCNQVTISANRLWNDLRTSKKFVKGIFRSYAKSKHFKN